MSITSISKAVVAVLLPREHLPFIRGWCRHHLDLGWKVFLYDNTGSKGSLRATSSFQSGNFQRQNTDKRGNHYGSYTEGVTDEEVRLAFETEVAGLDVEIVTWQPRDASGRIVHGQVEAYIDFILNQGDRFAWAAFIDADEYLHCGNGLSWDWLLDAVESRGCHRLMIEGIIYESRWSPDGKPAELGRLACCGSQVAGQKNIIRPNMTILADIHWGWRMEGTNQYSTVDPAQFHFRHYKGGLAQPSLTVHPPPPLQAESESLPVRLDRELADKSIEVLALDSIAGWRISEDLESFLITELQIFVTSPRKILELGPGYSTSVLADHFPDASVTSIEHDESWIRQQLRHLGRRSNVELIFAPLDQETLWYELNPADYSSIDLLLVDGPPGWIAPRVREKATCLVPCLSPGAVVIVNNTDREDEAASVAVWQGLGLEVVDTHPKFTVLRVSPESDGS